MLKQRENYMSTAKYEYLASHRHRHCLRLGAVCSKVCNAAASPNAEALDS